jgi:hypothetical protein
MSKKGLEQAKSFRVLEYASGWALISRAAHALDGFGQIEITHS